jgi:hypothetical protein
MLPFSTLGRARPPGPNLDVNGVNIRNWQRIYRFRLIETGTWRQVETGLGSEEKRSKTFGAIVAAMGEHHMAATMPFFEKRFGVNCQDPTKLWNWISEFPKFKQANAVQEAKAKHLQGVIETMVDSESPRAAFNAINQLEIQRVDLGAVRMDDNQLVIALLDATTRSRHPMNHLQHEMWRIRNGSKPPAEQIEPEGDETKAVKKYILIEAERLLTAEHEAYLARQLKFE